MATQSEIVTRYLREIGRTGGKKSRRTLAPAHARGMVAVREARRAFREHKADCFWSFDPDWQVGTDEIPLIVETLKREGNRRAFEQARRIQRMWESASCR